MNRKVLNEVALAAVIGAVFGVVVAIVLVAEFGLAKWATLIVAGLAGTLTGGICYCPGEVGRAIVDIGRRWKRNFVAGGKAINIAKPLIAVKDAFVTIAIGARTHRRTIFKWFYGILLALAFITVSRFTIGLLPVHYDEKGGIPEYLRPWVFGLGCSIVILFLNVIIMGVGLAGSTAWGAKRLQPSWRMPLSTRILKHIDDWDDLPDGKWKVRNFLVLGVIIALIPVLASLILLFAPVALAIDIVATLVLALASTERLASMAGALIGTVAGSICYFHEPSYLPAIAVGALIGGLSGRWLYALRRALVYRDPTVTTL